MPDKRRAIGILGGTFDPIHNGHLSIANHVLTHCKLEKVIFVPTGTPPHRAPPIATSRQRLEMTRLAIQNHQAFSVSDIESLKNGPSYTYNTLESLRKEYPDESISLIVGEDAFLTLPTWHQWEAIFNLAHIIVVERTHTVSKSHIINNLLTHKKSKEFSDLLNTKAGRVFILPMKPVDISATQIRRQLAFNEPTKGLPPSVQNYIDQFGIYAVDSGLATETNDA